MLKEQNEIDAPLGWWRYMQIRNLFNFDKRNGGFMRENIDFDKILLGEKDKILSKLYKNLLRNFTADEIIKIQMIRWMENFKRTVTMEEWEFL